MGFWWGAAACAGACLGAQQLEQLHDVDVATDERVRHGPHAQQARANGADHEVHLGRERELHGLRPPRSTWARKRTARSRSRAQQHAARSSAVPIPSHGAQHASPARTSPTARTLAHRPHLPHRPHAGLVKVAVRLKVRRRAARARLGRRLLPEHQPILALAPRRPHERARGGRDAQLAACAGRGNQQRWRQCPKCRQFASVMTSHQHCAARRGRGVCGHAC